MLQAAGGPPVQALLEIDHAEAAQCARLGSAVTRPPGSATCLIMHDAGLWEVPARVEVPEQGDSEPVGVLWPAVGGGVRSGRFPARPFGVQPGPGAPRR